MTDLPVGDPITEQIHAVDWSLEVPGDAPQSMVDALRARRSRRRKITLGMVTSVAVVGVLALVLGLPSLTRDSAPPVSDYSHIPAITLARLHRAGYDIAPPRQSAHINGQEALRRACRNQVMGRVWQAKRIPRRHEGQLPGRNPAVIPHILAHRLATAMDVHDQLWAAEPGQPPARLLHVCGGLHLDRRRDRRLRRIRPTGRQEPSTAAASTRAIALAPVAPASLESCGGHPVDAQTRTCGTGTLQRRATYSVRPLAAEGRDSGIGWVPRMTSAVAIGG